MDMPYSTGSTPTAAAVRAMMSRSKSVVVGDFMMTVSVSMAPSSSAAMPRGSSTPSISNSRATMAAVEPTGLALKRSGCAVTRPPRR